MLQHVKDVLGNITYQDDQRYNDHEGVLWLNVKNKDFYTIASAVLTGMYDTGKITNKDVSDKDSDFEEETTNDYTEQEFDNILSSNENIDKFVSQNSSAKRLVTEIWNFLKQYMSKGTITLYRGLVITNAQYSKMIETDPMIKYNPAKIIQYMDNTTKEFNSFSTDIQHANSFTDLYDDMYTDSIVFSAEADNNDVNWAFTAYLMGRHGGTWEHELNINNLKRLKNFKIENYVSFYTEFKNLCNIIQNSFTKYKNIGFTAFNDILKTTHTDNMTILPQDDGLYYHKCCNWRIFKVEFHKIEAKYIIGLVFNKKTKQFIFVHTFGDIIRCYDNGRLLLNNALYVLDYPEPWIKFSSCKELGDEGFTEYNPNHILVYDYYSNCKIYDVGTLNYLTKDNLKVIYPTILQKYPDIKQRLEDVNGITVQPNTIYFVNNTQEYKIVEIYQNGKVIKF